MEASDIDRLIEALLFVANGPTNLEDLAKAIEVEVEAVEEGLSRLRDGLEGRGVRLERVGRRVQLVSAPEASGAVERFLGLDVSGKLSPASLETLAIIAYRQPITRAQVDAIRGVNSDGVIRTLLAKNLVAPVGRLEQVGRPVLFGTTSDFMQYFGLTSLEELPNLPELGEPVEGSSLSAPTTV
ncbi:MAG: SMC-Scp complex subunit ScpB [Anaerolineae bacterium]